MLRNVYDKIGVSDRAELPLSRCITSHPWLEGSGAATASAAGRRQT